MKKNILVISPFNPFGPCLGGSSRTVRSRIERMSKDANVTLLTFYEESQDEKIVRTLNINTVYARYTRKENTMGKGLHRLWNIMSGRLMVFTHINAMVNELAPIAQDVVKKQKFDLIQIEDIIAAPVARHLPNDVQKILFFHNVLTTYYARVRDSRKTILKRLFAAIECFWIRRFEKAALRFVDTAVVLTDAEYKQVRKLSPSIALYSVPLEVDTAVITPSLATQEFPSMAFSGTMSYPPNQDAVVFCAESILPLIKKKRDTIKFYIIGRNPGPLVSQLASETIIVTGEVKNVEDYLARANVIVVPLLTGAGMRIKILEAFALGKAVVSTSLGAEGIAYSDGMNIMIADNPADFAEKVCFLLDNPEKASALGVEARRLAERGYSADVVWRKWQSIYEQIPIRK